MPWCPLVARIWTYRGSYGHQAGLCTGSSSWIRPNNFLSSLQILPCEHDFPMFQSKNLFNSAANFALSKMAFTIFSVAESVDQSNLLAIQTSHWQVSTVCIKPLKLSCGIIDFAPICQPVLHPKRLSFLEIRLRIICASRHIYLLASDHMYSSSSPHSDRRLIFRSVWIT